MAEFSFSPKFLLFLQDYASKAGKSPTVIIEEAVSQSILRHESAELPAHNALLMPNSVQRELLELLPDFSPATMAEATFGDFMEKLPERNWTYQSARAGDWWFLTVSLVPLELPEPVELRSVETNQAYAWLFGFTKSVRLWSAPDQFLIAF